MKKKLILSFVIFVIAVILVSIGVLFSIQKDKKIDNNRQENLVGLDVLDKANALEKYFMDKLPIIDIDSISNQDKLNFVFSILANEDEDSFTEKELQEVLKAYFGNDMTYKNEDIVSQSTGKVIAKYNPFQKKYAYHKVTNNENKDAYDILSYSNYQEAENTFEVQRQYLIIDKEQSPYVLYSKYEDYANKTNPIGTYDISATDNMFPSSIIDEYIQKLPVTKYSFVKQDGVFILNSITIA